MEALAAARVVTSAGVVGPAVVEIEDGFVARVVPTQGNVPDRTLVPGFVDLQVNGIDDVDVATAAGADWDRLDELLLEQGVTTWCPTLVSAPLDAYGPALDRVAAAAARPGPLPAIAGAHLEGPFLTRAGAHKPEHLAAIDDAWLAELPPIVRVVTLAPEQPGAIDAIRRLAARGVLVALGHSDADHDTALAAAAAGARLVTHCFNGMPPLHHRAPGLAGAALSDDRLAVSLIADLVHVHPAVLRLAARAKGRGGWVSVTDSVAWRAGRVGTVAMSVAAGAPRLSDGTLAGSSLTMDAALRNFVGPAQLSLEDALASMTSTPAALLGATDRGVLAAGARADVVALDADLAVCEVWVAGERVR